MLSLWQSGCYRLMDDDVPYPSAFPTAKGAPTPYKDDDGEARSEGSGPQSLPRSPQAHGAAGALRTTTQQANSYQAARTASQPTA